MSEMVKISVNDVQIEALENSLLIDVLINKDINIPHFCYHQALGKDGNCRMCMVEIEGQKRPQISCNTLVKNNMIVRTVGEKIEKVRRDILELELLNHPIDCPTCDQAGECKLQDYYMQSGFYESRINLELKNNEKKRVDLGSNVMLDQERCVLCTRCTRFCSDITKTNELVVINRTDHSVIGTFPGMPLSNPYAMNVVDLCPVGALTSKDFRFKQRVWFLESFNAICNLCSKGCNIIVDHKKNKYKDDQIFRFRPRRNDEVNGYFICDEGRLSYKEQNENRFLDIKSKLEINTLDTAISYIYDLIQNNSKILFLLGPNLSYEEMYNIQNISKILNSNISGYSPTYFDESFQDDYLRTNDKSVNQASFRELGISYDKDSFTYFLNYSTLVIILDNNYFNTNIYKLKNKKVISFFSHKCLTIEKSDISIPITSFYEKSGTYINASGIKQKVISKMNKNTPSFSINFIIESLQTSIKKGIL